MIDLKVANDSDIERFVLEHLVRQGARSRSDCSSIFFPCAYRGENGMFCAIGCLIPQDILNTCKDIIEGVPVADMAENMRAFGYDAQADWVDQNLGLHMPVLSYLQNVHDKLKPSDWQAMLYGTNPRAAFTT